MSLLARLRARSTRAASEPTEHEIEHERGAQHQGGVHTSDGSPAPEPDSVPSRIRDTDALAEHRFGSQYRVRRDHNEVVADRLGPRGAVPIPTLGRRGGAQARAARHLGVDEVVFGDAP